MVTFETDYVCGAHPKVLERIVETNMEPVVGYTCDKFCEMAADKIRKAVDMPEADVRFLVGGTQTNQLVIDSMLDSYEGVVAAETGHVSVHEAGAIEFSGHKVLNVPAYDGKLKAEDVKTLCKNFWVDESYEHMVFPGMVYISQPTEYGTLYSKAELKELYAVCKEYEMVLYIDGARLIYAMGSKDFDMTLPEMARLCDAFYIGGTKAGALCGEALVFTNAKAPKRFLTRTKQHGALLAKGRLLGVQFDALFTDDLYLEIGKTGCQASEEVKAIFKEKGVKVYLESPTNQQFVIMEKDKIEKLREHIAFEFWEVYDDTSDVVRFVTSWSTKKEDLEELRKYL